MTRQGKTALFALLALALTIPLQAADVPTDFMATHYYLLSMGEMDVDLTALMAATQSAGFSIIQYADEDVVVSRGGEQVEIDLETALADEAVLLIDSNRFYLRQVESTFAYTVRPAEMGYELVINPSQDLSISNTLTAILVRLQEFGILGNEVNLDFVSFAKADLKGPAAPEGVLMDSDLYGLTVAEDWFAYASLKAFIQVGLSVQAVAEKLPDGVLSPEFEAYVVQETDTLVKLLLPIDQLLALAKSSAVGYVRPAYQPMVP